MSNTAINLTNYLVPRINIPEHIETRFGVELEICANANEDCLDFKNTANKLPFLDFKDKFELFFKNIILKSRTYNEVRDKYTYIGLNTGYGYYLYNMFTPFEKNGTTIKSESVNPGSDKIKYFFDFKIPIIMDDVTIICGDSGAPEEQSNANLPTKKSINFECITPVLSFRGTMTKEKLKSTLNPLLELFGVKNPDDLNYSTKPDCLIINYSMGFHVNTSLYDTINKQFLKIAVPPFLNRLLKNYIQEERELYSAVRSMRPISKRNLENYTTTWAYPLYKNLNRRKNTTNSNKTNNAIINLMTNKLYMDQKSRALKYKTDYLLEFRLFESSSNLLRLLLYTEIAIELLHKTYKQCVVQGIEIPLEPKEIQTLPIKFKQDGGKKKLRKMKKFEHKRHYTKKRKQ
jgi:hypothetical protein